MRSTLLALMMFFATPHGQQTISASFPPAPSGCTLPPVTSDWLASNSCSTGAACMNDAVGGNNATQSVSGDVPTYSASGTFSHPYLTFNGSTDFLNLGTGIPHTNTTYSFLVVGNFASVSTGAYVIAGVSLSLGYRINPNQQLALAGSTVTATGTASYSTSTKYALVATINTSTNAYTFSKLSGGSVTADGSGTASALPYSVNITTIGVGGTASAYLAAATPEIIYYNGVWTGGNLTTAAAYVACRYSI